VRQGLLRSRDDYVRVAMNADKSHEVREQAAGTANFIDYMLDFIEKELPAFHKLRAEGEEQ